MFVAAAYERRSLGVASHWPFESWDRFLPEHTTAAVSMLDRLQRQCHVVVTDGDSYRMKQARARGAASRKTSSCIPEERGLLTGHTRDLNLAVDTFAPQ